MLRKTVFASLLASSAMTLAIASPAAAGPTDRAREAIAAAEAKIHTAENLGASIDAPRDTAEARAALASAKEDFATGHKEPAIQEAIRASALAETAMGISQQHRDDDVANAREGQRATVEQLPAIRSLLRKVGEAAAQDQAFAAPATGRSLRQQATPTPPRAPRPLSNPRPLRRLTPPSRATLQR